MKTASENSKFRTAQRTVMVRSAVSRCSGQMGWGQVFSRCGTLQIRLGRPFKESCKLYEPVWPELSKKVGLHRTHPRALYQLLKLQLFLAGDYLGSGVHTNSINNTWKLGTCSSSRLAVFDVPVIWVECYLKQQVSICLSVIKHGIKVVPVFLGDLRNSTVCKCMSFGTVQGCTNVVALSLDSTWWPEWGLSYLNIWY